MKRDTLDKIVNRLEHLDTEELRHLFMRLASEKGLLQDVFDALRDGLILFDSEGAPRFANKAACAIYGRSIKELLHVPFERLVGGTCTWQEVCGSGIAISRDLHVNYPEERHYNFLMSPVADGSEYLLLIRDDTERLAAGEEDAEAEQFNLHFHHNFAFLRLIGDPGGIDDGAGADVQRFVILFPFVCPVLFVQTYQFDFRGKGKGGKAVAQEGDRVGKASFLGNVDGNRGDGAVAVEDFLVNQFAVNGHEVFLDVAVILDHQTLVEHTHYGADRVKFFLRAGHTQLCPFHSCSFIIVFEIVFIIFEALPQAPPNFFEKKFGSQNFN